MSTGRWALEAAARKGAERRWGGPGRGECGSGIRVRPRPEAAGLSGRS